MQQIINISQVSIQVSMFPLSLVPKSEPSTITFSAPTSNSWLRVTLALRFHRRERWTQLLEFSPLQTYVLVGGFNHLEKYESQWEGLSHILWKIKYFCAWHSVANLGHAALAVLLRSNASQKLQRASGPRGRARQMLGQPRFNKPKLIKAKMETNGPFETTNPLRIRSDGPGHETHVSILQKLLKHQSEVLHTHPKLRVVRQPCNFAPFGVPFPGTFENGPWPETELKTYVQMNVRNPSKSIGRGTDAGDPTLYISGKLSWKKLPKSRVTQLYALG